MQLISASLLPIFLLILLGYLFKRFSFPSADFWIYSDKFTYFVLFPALLIYKLTTAKLEGINGFYFVLTLFVVIFLLSAILIIVSKIFFNFKNRDFTSIYQGAIRFNSYVLFALSDVLFGDKGLILSALLVTFVVPLINVLCVLIFSIYVPSSTLSVLSIIKSLSKNPLILACLFGGILNFFGIKLFLPLEKTLQLLSSAALPLGLLSVGVGLQISYIKKLKSELFIASMFKLVFFPVLMYFIASFFALKVETIVFLVLYAALPTATSSYILARQLGGNLTLMSAIITTQTILSIVSISALLLFFNTLKLS